MKTEVATTKRYEKESDLLLPDKYPLEVSILPLSFANDH